MSALQRVKHIARLEFLLTSQPRRRYSDVLGIRVSVWEYFVREEFGETSPLQGAEVGRGVCWAESDARLHVRDLANYVGPSLV